ncbi:ATP-binding protein [Serratia bockelmannii]|uniref:ATP-binding protein n=1 Tax=Serratia bockelmannii TaxID=2703793 RepID=UPI0023615272|nr:ATP-binding protein [Serratia bockelmannii]
MKKKPTASSAESIKTDDRLPLGTCAQALTAGMTITSLGPWLEYVDMVLRGLLLWQQEHEADRLNIAELLLSEEALAAARERPSGTPNWSRQSDSVPWLQGLQPPPAAGRLACVVERFGLTLFETQILVLTALPLFDDRYEKLMAYLQGEDTLPWPGIDLALKLFCATPVDRIDCRLTLCSRHGVLLQAGLVATIDRSGRRAANDDAVYLRMEAAAFHFLSGGAPEALRVGSGEAARWYEPANNASLREGTWATYATQLERLCFTSFSHRAAQQVQVLGGQGRMALLGQLARDAGRPMLVLNVGLLPQNPTDARQVLCGALRAVRLYAGMLVLHDWADATSEQRILLNTFGHVLADSRYPVICLVSPQEAGSVFPTLSAVSITLPPRSLQDDARILKSGQPDGVTAGDWDWEGLVRRVLVDPESLEQVWQEAQGYRLLRGPHARLREADLQQALRVRGRQHFGPLAQRVDPRRTFDDLIVSEPLALHLQDILAAVRQREAVLGRGFARKVGYGTGISVLFCGPSGTGKTMAAEVLAGALGLDLIRVDLSMVVNKYIGETEKNLAKMFDLALADTGVLLFDEADALFGKRSEVKDAHDRHANIEVSYLLQRLEQYPGLVVMTTNNRAHLDDAFTRRLTFILRFDAPDATLREQMWRAIWPEQVAVDDSVDFARWAAAIDLTGAGIRNVALMASWLAAEAGRAVNLADIERAVKRELDKTGRLMLRTPGG